MNLGAIIPSVEDLYDLANALEVNPEILLDIESSYINNFNNYKNLLDTNELYLYYKTSSGSHKCIFKLEIIETNSSNIVKFIDLNDNSILYIGKVRMNYDCAIFSLENYEPNNNIMETLQIIINVRKSTDNLMMGFMYGIKDGYMPSTRKVILSKEKIKFTNEMLERLKVTDRELEQFKKDDYYEPDIKNESNYNN